MFLRINFSESAEGIFGISSRKAASKINLFAPFAEPEDQLNFSHCHAKTRPTFNHENARESKQKRNENINNKRLD